MKVYSRPLNDGEMFCTSIKAAKSVFQNTEVKLCFGEFGRQYNPYKNEFGYGYYKKNIKGTVVASMILHPGVNSPLLGFYVVKSYSISDSMKDYFEKDILYKLRRLYDEFCSGDPREQKDTIIWVEWLNDRFNTHQFVLK